MHINSTSSESPEKLNPQNFLARRHGDLNLRASLLFKAQGRAEQRTANTRQRGRPRKAGVGVDGHVTDVETQTVLTFGIA